MRPDVDCNLVNIHFVQVLEQYSVPGKELAARSFYIPVSAFGNG